MKGDELSTMFTLCVIFSVLPLLFSLFLWVALITGGVLQGEDIIKNIAIVSALIGGAFSLIAFRLRKNRSRSEVSPDRPASASSVVEPGTLYSALAEEAQLLQQTALFLKWCKRNTRFLPDSHYPSNMRTDWKIENPSQFHRWLLQTGYLEEMSLEQRIRALKVVDLKHLLKELELPVSGKKDDLISRILENGDFDSILSVIGEQKEFSLTSKAYQFLSEYYDMMSLKSAQLNLQNYQEDGVEKYQILATLDGKTCELCGNMDGKIYAITDAVIGKNVPPFHPGCRCTTTPYYDDMDLSDMPRIARNPQTGETYEVPGDMTYNKWKKTFKPQ